MQLTGRTLVLSTLAIALAMAGGAWLYHYQSSRQAAKFWGPEATQLLIGTASVEFLELQEADDRAPDAEAIAGRAIVARHDLTEKPGLIHLRHGLTQDANFLWDARRREPINVDYDWAYALRFEDDQRRLDVLLRRDFQQLGKVTTDGKSIDVAPCPRLAPAMQQYFRDVGVLSKVAAPR